MNMKRLAATTMAPFLCATIMMGSSKAFDSFLGVILPFPVYMGNIMLSPLYLDIFNNFVFRLYTGFDACITDEKKLN
jgi:hypothetical protein